MTELILTPDELRARLSVVPSEFQKVIDEAEATGRKIIYYVKETPFGNFPMAAELEMVAPVNDKGMKDLRLMRTFEDITADIRADWKNIHFAAQPYLQAMRRLNDIDDMYGADSGRSIVAYFLSNAATWRGPVARKIKAELNKMLK